MSRKPTTIPSCARWHPGQPSEIVVSGRILKGKASQIRRCAVCAKLIAAHNGQRDRTDPHAPYGPMLGVHQLNWTPPERLV